MFRQPDTSQVNCSSTVFVVQLHKTCIHDSRSINGHVKDQHGELENA